MTEHTPTPWKVLSSGCGVVQDLSGWTIANLGRKDTVYGDNERRENAALIVRAANAHDDLVALARNILDEAVCGLDNREASIVEGWQDMTRAALAKVFP